jgi:hypothetical protein
MKLSLAPKKLPLWVITVVFCIGAVVSILLGLLLTGKYATFFTTSRGSFVTNLISEIAGIFISVLVALYVVEWYLGRRKSLEMAKRRVPYLSSLVSGINLSLNALCLELKCSFIERKKLSSDLYITKGHESELREWLKGIEEGEPLQFIDVKTLQSCLDYIAQYSFKSPLDEIQTVIHLFDDAPGFTKELFKVRHNLQTAQMYFRFPDVKTITSDGQKLLGGLGIALLDLSEQTGSLLGSEKTIEIAKG